MTLSKGQALLPAMIIALSLATCVTEPSASDALDARVLTGDWIGTYTCRQGLTGLTLSLAGHSDGRVDAVFSFYPVQSNPLVPRGSFTMRGKYSRWDGPMHRSGSVGHLLLEARESGWINRPADWLTVDLDGIVDLDASTYTGDVPTPGCTTFSLEVVYLLPLPGGIEWPVTAGIGQGGHVCPGAQTDCSYHYSIDFARPADFASGGHSNVGIRAAAGGVVDSVRWDVSDPPGPQCPTFPDPGNFVRIRHPAGTYTSYMHLAENSIPEELRVQGHQVRQGDFLGVMGRTGCTAGLTGIHLHFQVNTGTPTSVDPRLRDFRLDGRRLEEYRANQSYLSNNRP